MALLNIKNLNFAYPKSQYKTLSNINIEIEEGSFVLLCGQSGCGKSTLLKHLKKEFFPHGVRDGEVLYNDADILSMDTRTSAENIGFVMQDIDNQIVTDKVYSELAFGLESLGLSSDIIRRRIAEMASFFGIHNWFREETSKLSGGQKQMLNLASVMAMQPKIIILDEPTSQLDPIAGAEFLNTIARINSNLGTTIVITEHRLEEVFPRADKIFVMDSGQIIAEGSPRDVASRLALNSNKHVISSAFPAAVRLFAGVKSDLGCPLTVKEGRAFVKEYTKNKNIKAETPIEKSKKPAPQKREKDNEAVRLRELFFRYEKNSYDVLRGLSLTVKRGDLCCILGGNGSGKTTALSALCGLNKCYRGQIDIFGKRIESYKNNNFYGKIISALPQNPQALFTNKTVKQELFDMTKDKTAIDNVIDELDIKSFLESHPYDLSGGEQQKVAFAKVLLCEPEIILLDEPTKGLDAYYKAKFGKLLTSLCERGKTIIVATHDIEFAANYAKRCCLFFDGQIISEGAAEEFFSGNYFYTTAANRIARAIESTAISPEALAAELNT